MKRACASHRFPARCLALLVCLLALSTGASAQDQKPAQTNTNAASDELVDISNTFTVKEVTQKARILSRAEPQYTESARKNDIEGTVVIRAVLSSSGKVMSIRVVSGLPYGLTEKAVAAAHKIKFVPAQKGGRSVSQYIQIEYNFHIYYSDDSPTLSRRVQILDQPQPEYTAEARQHHTHGKVVLRVTFAPEQGIEEIEVVEGLPYGLTESAIAAARKIRFEPGVNRRGTPVRVVKLIEYEFKE